MHNPTFKSLEEIFNIRREATVTKLDSIGPRGASLQNDSTFHNETLAALVEEAKAVLAKLEVALANVISSEAPQSGAQSRNLTRIIASHPERAKRVEGSNPIGIRSLDYARDDKGMYARDDVLDGVFDGRQMISDDGTTYPVPENYASKSKLLEGDLLQLVKTADGRTYFKQITRVPRRTINARLERIDATAGFATAQDGTSYQIPHAPIRFFRMTPGETIILEVPADGGCWAAVVGRSEVCYTDATSRHAEQSLTGRAGAGPGEASHTDRMGSFVPTSRNSG